MAIDSGIKEIGYTNDGQVWMNVIVALNLAKTAEACEKLKNEDVKEFPLKATVMLGTAMVDELIKTLQIAQKNGQEWLKTGVNPQGNGQNNA